MSYEIDEEFLDVLSYIVTTEIRDKFDVANELPGRQRAFANLYNGITKRIFDYCEKKIIHKLDCICPKCMDNEVEELLTDRFNT